MSERGRKGGRLLKWIGGGGEGEEEEEEKGVRLIRLPIHPTSFSPSLAKREI